MKRIVKWAALVGAGGVIMQVGGCGTILVQLLFQNVLSTAIGAALSSLINGANAG